MSIGVASWSLRDGYRSWSCVGESGKEGKDECGGALHNGGYVMAIV